MPSSVVLGGNRVNVISMPSTSFKVSKPDSSVNVITPPNPVFTVEEPDTSINIVLPVTGPPGPAGPPGSIESFTWDLIQNKPNSFPPAPHVHPQSDVINLIGALNTIESAVESSESMIDLTTIFENSIA